jgi:predicted PurR-regulated permease PerM
MHETSAVADWRRTLFVLNGTVLAAAIIAILYWAQVIFIPLALAAFLTFLLNPFVTRFRQRGLGRTPAVVVVVVLAAFALGGVSWLVTNQISSLLREIPEYSQNVKRKVKSLKRIMDGSGRFMRVFDEIGHALGEGASPARVVGMGDERIESPEQVPTAVVVQPRTPAWLAPATHFLSLVMEHLSQLALALILVVFMLQRREELRNRIIRLVGHGRIVAATKFVDEAGQRISRFLLMQAIVNGTFGLALGVGLMIIGLKYALLLGFLAGTLRYLPFIGPCLAALFPISLSLAMFDGWGPALLAAGLFLVLELIVSNAVEPWLYGQSMGVSAIALLVSAAFWAFLWGPIGLVLASPLTVCLVVLGRHNPQLEFLTVLLGDEPALDAGISFYQRLLAKDQDEAEDLILERAARDPLDVVCDSMLLPALSATRQSRMRREITEHDERYVLESIRQIAGELSEWRSEAGPRAAGATDPESPPGPAPVPPLYILGCPAQDTIDRVALELVRGLLDPLKWEMDLVAPETLTSEVTELVGQRQPLVVCIVSLPPGGVARTRYLCKRLRRRDPELRILVCRWGAPDGGESNPARLEDAGAGTVTSSVTETLRQLASLSPILSQARDRHMVELGAASGRTTLEPHGGNRPSPRGVGVK